jgi:uncharacterized membrane protein
VLLLLRLLMLVLLLLVMADRLAAVRRRIRRLPVLPRQRRIVCVWVHGGADVYLDS